MTLRVALLDMAGDPPGGDPWPVTGAVDGAVGEEVNEGDQRCATCGRIFPERSGAFVDFHEEYGVKVRRSMASGDAKFEHPSRRWFCPRHIGPAMMIRDTVEAAQARTILLPDGRAPFEYDEAPPGVVIGSVDAHGEPMRGPFLPMPDDSFDEVGARSYDVVGRVATDGFPILHASLTSLGEALGVDHLRAAGSIGSASSDPADLRWVEAASSCSTNVAVRHGGNVAVFMITARHLVDENVRGEHVRLLVQQRERTILEVVVAAGSNAVVAPDGRVLLDHLHVRVAGDRAATLGAAIDGMLAALNEPSPDPFELRPDIDGVDLVGGVIRRSTSEGKSSIEWQLAPVGSASARQQLVELVPLLFDELGLGPVPELDRTTRRDWNPMDGSREPNCPYVDHVLHEAKASDGRTLVSVESEQAHWSDEDISNVHVSLFLHVEGVRVSAYAAGRGHHNACTSLSLFRPTSAAVIALLTGAFSQWLD